MLHHFIHYSTVTQDSSLNKKDFEKLGKRFKVNYGVDHLSRFGDEVNEALMLHTKAVAHQDTVSDNGYGKADVCFLLSIYGSYM